MADQNFNIKVVTTADTTGIRQTAAELERLRAQRGLLAPLPIGLFEKEGEAAAAAANTAKVAEELKKVGSASLFAGINIGKVRQEATFLARELATGVPSTRTLSSLLGAMGPYIAGAVGAGFALNRAIVANAERQLKVNQELDVQLTKVTELSQKWSELAKSATGPGDLLKVTSAIIPTLDQASEKFREFQNTSAVKEGWQSILETFTAGIPGVGKMFDVAFEKQANVLADNAQRLNQAAGAALKSGLDQQREAHEDIDKVIARENAKLREQQAQLRYIDPKENLKSWASIEATIERITKNLELLNAQREKQVKAGEPTTKSGLLGQQEGQFQDLLKSTNLTPAEREAISQQITQTQTDKFNKDIKDRTDAFNKEIADRDKRFTTPPGQPSRSTGVPITPGVPISPGIPLTGSTAPVGEKTTETNQALITAIKQAFDETMSRYWGP